MTTNKQTPSFAFDDDICKSTDGFAGGLVCGIDEVGRGPLAGPVVAAAVVIDRQRLSDDIAAQINDSKKITAKKRAFLFEKIHECADVSIAEISVADIDRINILQASLLAMQQACRSLPFPVALALVDGNKAPALPCPARTVIGGDGKSLSIAAASIVAKHHRDTLMAALAKTFPHYGWEKNAGYGTAKHLAALKQYGITPHHRLSFAPVRHVAARKSA